MNNNYISLSNLELMPDIQRFEKISKSIAILDAIIMPDWEYRYYSFNSKWDNGEMMASMRDGSGNSYYSLINDSGIIIKGFEKNSPFAQFNIENGKPYPGILDDVPSDFKSFITEPAFVVNEATFCIWYSRTKMVWQTGKLNAPNDKLAYPLRLLKVFVNGAIGYKKWAEEYYEVSLSIDNIQYIWDFKPLTGSCVSAINKDVTLEDLAEDIEEIGYPIQNV